MSGRCYATREELLLAVHPVEDRILKLLDMCPICSALGIKLRVGNHRSVSSSEDATPRTSISKKRSAESPDQPGGLEI